jgi:lactoylglutathione lyase
MTLLGIAHASVVVSDMERSLRFYRDALGLTVTDDDRLTGPFVSAVTGLPGTDVRVVLLSAGDPVARVELVEFRTPSGTGAAPAMPAIGASHVALLTDDIHAAHRAVVEAGGRPVSPPVENGVHWAMHVLDPDDVRVELMQAIGRPGPGPVPCGAIWRVRAGPSADAAHEPKPSRKSPKTSEGI